MIDVSAVLSSGCFGEILQHLAGRLESEPTLHDAAARDNVQHTAFHDGNMMQQIGALLLELGRATLSLRMGQSPVRFSNASLSYLLQKSILTSERRNVLV